MAKYTMTDVHEMLYELPDGDQVTGYQRELILAVLNNPDDIGYRATAG
jgi:hypothetical protein